LNKAALAEVKVHENEIPIFQPLDVQPLNFLTATAALMRCHLSEMFGAVRIAIDAALAQRAPLPRVFRFPSPWP
jgi:hypothetical protein